MTNDGIALISTAHPRPYWTYKPTKDGPSPLRAANRIAEDLLVTVEIDRVSFAASKRLIRSAGWL